MHLKFENNIFHSVSQDMICVDLSSLYPSGLGCRIYLWDEGSL